MMTVLLIAEWRLYFNGKSGEPVNIHVQKDDMAANYWLDDDLFDLREVYSYNMGTSDSREIRKIIFEHFDYLVEQWSQYKKQQSPAVV